MAPGDTFAATHRAEVVLAQSLLKADLSLKEARRIALTAQGFDRPRPNRVDIRHLRRILHQLGLLQVDFVNVLVPAHYLVPFSRLGPYDPSRLHDLTHVRREFTEQWAHEASILPMECWPLLRHRMKTHRVRPWGFEKFMAARPDYMQAVLDIVRAKGPVTADDIPEADDVPKYIPGAWVRRIPRAALEAHLGTGTLAVANRLPNFARVYDFAERVIPNEHHSRQVGTDESQRELLRRAARSHGVGTAGDLADYYRMNIKDARTRLLELVEEGDLEKVRVEGWRDAAYLHPKAKVPRHLYARAILSPFDPVVWCRERGERLFDFEYRIEIYVPAPERKWGYYVLPFLLGDRLVARVDLKADRKARRLLVQAAHVEPHAKPARVASALGKELRLVADWLGLESIRVGRKGGLARQLSGAVNG